MEFAECEGYQRVLAEEEAKARQTPQLRAARVRSFQLTWLRTVQVDRKARKGREERPTDSRGPEGRNLETEPTRSASPIPRECFLFVLVRSGRWKSDGSDLRDAREPL